CTVEDGALVGMGAIVLNGARIGAGSLVAAGPVVPQGFVVPPGTMIAGVPGKIRRELTEDEINHNRINGQVYEHLLTLHRG
ncbi:MAG TPA: gamma carbonic anhydrase family protein, partial [Mycobacterium sp.]